MDAWDTVLQDHPDQIFVQLVLAGLRKGFRIGFDRQAPVQLCNRNMQSAPQSHQGVSLFPRPHVTSVCGPRLPATSAMPHQSCHPEGSEYYEMAPDHQLILLTWRECQRWHQLGALPPLIYVCRAGCGDGHRLRGSSSNGQDRHRGSVPTHTGVTTGPPCTGYAVGQSYIPQSHATFHPALRSQDLQRCGGRPRAVPLQRRCVPRFHYSL